MAHLLLSDKIYDLLNVRQDNASTHHGAEELAQIDRAIRHYTGQPRVGGRQVGELPFGPTPLFDKVSILLLRRGQSRPGVAPPSTAIAVP